MRPTLCKKEVHELLQQTLQQLKESYSVSCVLLKTCVKVKVLYKHSDSEIVLADFTVKNTVKEIQQLIDRLSALYTISEDVKHFFKLCDALDCSVSQHDEFTNEIVIRQRYDAPQLKNFVNVSSASTETLSLRKDAADRLEELRELAEICTIEFSDSMIDIKSFYSALETLRTLKENFAEHRQSFNAVLKIVAQFVRAANKLTTRDNAEYLRELKIAKQKEAEALKIADYDNVSDETLKTYLKENFAAFSSDDKLLILDKSSEHRAVLAAVLEYVNYEGLVVDKLVLAGEDDNGERWSHCISQLLFDKYVDPCFYERFIKIDDCPIKTVEQAMSKLFDVDIHEVDSDFKKAIRQGDILFMPLKHPHSIESLKSLRCEKTTEYDVAPSHTLKSEKPFKVLYDKKSLYIFNEAPATLEHPSHTPVTIPAGAWAVYKNTAPNLKGGVGLMLDEKELKRVCELTEQLLPKLTFYNALTEVLEKHFPRFHDYFGLLYDNETGDVYFRDGKTDKIIHFYEKYEPFNTTVHYTVYDDIFDFLKSDFIDNSDKASVLSAFIEQGEDGEVSYGDYNTYMKIFDNRDNTYRYYIYHADIDELREYDEQEFREEMSREFDDLIVKSFMGDNIDE